MISVSSSSSANDYGLQQIRLQQARRNADQAEQAAQSLKTQADAAQRVADREQENARSLYVQSDQAQTKAGQARQGLAAFSSAQQAITQLSKSVDQVLSREQVPAEVVSSAAAPPASSVGAAVTNSQGQVTGKIVNATQQMQLPRPTQQSEPSGATKSADDAAKAKQAQEQQSQQSQPPRPVTNTLGHQTGTMINIAV
jgi:hypothetical protein